MSLRSFATSFLDTGGPVPFFTHMTNNDASPLHDYDNWAVFVHKLWGADDAEMLGHRLESTLAVSLSVRRHSAIQKTILIITR